MLRAQCCNSNGLRFTLRDGLATGRLARTERRHRGWDRSIAPAASVGLAAMTAVRLGSIPDSSRKVGADPPPINAEQKETGTSPRFDLPVYATLPPPRSMFELNCSADHACVTSARRRSIMAQRERLTEKLVRAAEPRGASTRFSTRMCGGFRCGFSIRQPEFHAGLPGQGPPAPLYHRQVAGMDRHRRARAGQGAAPHHRRWRRPAGRARNRHDGPPHPRSDRPLYRNPPAQSGPDQSLRPDFHAAQAGPAGLEAQAGRGYHAG